MPEGSELSAADEPGAPPEPAHVRQLLTRRAWLGLAAGAGVLAAGGLAGCGAGGDSDPVDPLPADRLVFGVSGGGSGFSPPIFAALQSPYLVVYGSGLVLRADDGPLRAVPSRYVRAQVDPVRVARFVADVERSQVLQGDLGSPQVTDLGSTRVWVHGAGERQQVTPYAFDEQFDEYLPWPARRRRRRLRAVIAEAGALVGDAGGAYVPPRVVVLEQLADEDDRSSAPRWPGPTPATFLHRPTGYVRGALACGALTGDAAATVYAAALDNPEQRWLVGDTVRVLAVNPLPVEIDC